MAVVGVVVNNHVDTPDLLFVFQLSALGLESLSNQTKNMVGSSVMQYWYFRFSKVGAVVFLKAVKHQKTRRKLLYQPTTRTLVVCQEEETDDSSKPKPVNLEYIVDPNNQT